MRNMPSLCGRPFQSQMRLQLLACYFGQYMYWRYATFTLIILPEGAWSWSFLTILLGIDVPRFE